MKRSTSRHNDGGRQRCLQCGHPRREHHDVIGCSVPKCTCSEYAGAEVKVTPESS